MAESICPYIVVNHAYFDVLLICVNRIFTITSDKFLVREIFMVNIIAYTNRLLIVCRKLNGSVDLLHIKLFDENLNPKLNYVVTVTISFTFSTLYVLGT